MQITFNAYDSKAEIELVRDLAAQIIERYDEINPSYGPDTPEDEVDARVDVPVLLSTNHPDAPKPPTGPHDFPAGAEQIPPAPVTPREIPETHPDGAEILQQDIDPEATPAVERDKHGRVWDERIDSGNRKQTTAGEWMKRKNVDPEVRAAVLAELSQSAPETTFAAAQEEAPKAESPAPMPPSTATTAPPPPATTATPAPGSPAPLTPAAPEAPAGASIEWGEVFQRTMKAQMAQLLSQEQIDAKCAEYGIEGFPALLAHPDKWDMFLMELGIE